MGPARHDRRGLRRQRGDQPRERVPGRLRPGLAGRRDRAGVERALEPHDRGRQLRRRGRYRDRGAQLPATRVREIHLNAGLPASNAKRPLELVPQAIGVRFDSGPCRSFTLQSTADLQRLVVDSQVPVRTVTIGVDTTFPGRPDSARVLSITEVGLRSRPS